MTQTNTADPKISKAQEFLADQAKRLAALETSQADMIAQIKTVAGSIEGLSTTVKGLDLKPILSQIEQIKAGHTAVVRQIQRSSAHQISGAEDLAPNFSMIKALASVKTNGQLHGKSVEWELMQQARKSGNQIAGVESDGSWFIPDQVIPQVIASIYRKSQFIDLAGDGTTRVTPIDGLTGAQVRIPKFKKGVIAYWGGELDKAKVEKASTGMLTMTPKKLNVLTEMTEEQARFGSFGFEQLLRNDMQRAMSEEMDRVIAYGKGNSDEPEGITKFAINTYVAGGNAAVHSVLDWSGLSAMDLLIEDSDLQKDATFATVSSPAFFQYLSNLRVLNFSGQAAADADYLAGLPPLTQARLADLIGPFGKTTMIKSNKDVGDGAAKATDVFRGNFGEILVGRWSGIEIVSENGFDILSDARRIKLRMYCDVGCRYPKAISYCPNAKARA